MSDSGRPDKVGFRRIIETTIAQPAPLKGTRPCTVNPLAIPKSWPS
jgi:hypothetical protein